MNKLQWCRENAPESAKDLPDEDLLELMSSSYDMFCEDKEDTSVTSSHSYGEKTATNNCLDYMVVELYKEFGNDLVFKGGYMLNQILGIDSRQTYDIDFSICTETLYNAVKLKLVDLAEHFKSEGIIDLYKVKDTIAPTMSGGIDMYKNNEKILGVDVGWHDTSYGTKVWNVSVGDLCAFEVERMLSDKLSAILSRKRFRRSKDLYDFYVITNNFDFSVAKLVDYMEHSAKNGRDIEWCNFPFNDDVVREYGRAYDKLKVVSIFADGKVDKPDYSKALSRYNTIATFVREATTYNYVWKHESKTFEVSV